MARTEAPRNWRLQPQRLRLEGAICSHCGDPQFPPRAVCPTCGGERGVVYFSTPKSYSERLSGRNPVSTKP